MAFLGERISRRISRGRVQDIIFLIGIFLFSVLLILGLFPNTDSKSGSGRSFFLFYIMIVPVIAAVYFIIISFRRRLYYGSSEVGSSIRLKITIAFIFVAVLPSLPIILISNNLISQSLTGIFTGETSKALEESIVMSKESIVSQHMQMESELKNLDDSFRRGRFTPTAFQSRRDLEKSFQRKGYRILFFKIHGQELLNNRLIDVDRRGQGNEHYRNIHRFMQAVNLKHRYAVQNISIKDVSILIGRVVFGGYLVVPYTVLSNRIFERISLYEDSLRRYKQSEFLKNYFETGAGIMLLLLAALIIIVAIVVSLLLARNITRPVLVLAHAADEVASGNFDIHLERSSPDELSFLFESFNKMAAQLDDSRKILYKTQKLEAWQDVARKLVHEIKNPLTPIRLSAERIFRRYKEGHPDIDKIVITGTETIIEEVSVLMRILSEFTRFARLPVSNPEIEELNPVIKNSVNFFHGHEGISFHVELSDDVPPVSFDKMLFRQVLTNLLQNAVDAVGGKGTIVVQSMVTESGGKDVVRIRIEDDGIGIASEDQHKIFDPSFSLKEQGTGLGLAIVEMIILDHKGRIYYESKPEGGSIFSIELPVLIEVTKGGGANGEDSDS